MGRVGSGTTAGPRGGWDTPKQLGLESASTTSPISHSLGQSLMDLPGARAGLFHLRVLRAVLVCFPRLAACQIVRTIPGRARSCLIPMSVPSPVIPVSLPRYKCAAWFHLGSVFSFFLCSFSFLSSFFLFSFFPFCVSSACVIRG